MTAYRNVVITVDGRIAGQQEIGPDRWITFHADPVLALIREAFYRSDDAAQQLWAIQDGMPGISGSEASWDWSALRDSSPRATRDLYDVASTVVTVADMAAMWGVDPTALTDATDTSLALLDTLRDQPEPGPAWRINLQTGEAEQDRRGPDAR
jgi:hypothetical protein